MTFFPICGSCNYKEKLMTFIRPITKTDKCSLFPGDNCEIDYDECEIFQPCMNGATCFDAVNSFICICPEGYTGNCIKMD